MFLAIQVIAILLSYFGLYVFVPWLFGQRSAALSRRTVVSLVGALACVVVFLAIAFIVPSAFWSNRLQHALAGGFVLMFICFRVVKDSGIPLDPLRFFVVAGLFATTLGVTSEIAEFYFQTTTDLMFADSIEDTWWDLLSNAIGATLGGLVFAPFISSKR